MSAPASSEEKAEVLTELDGGTFLMSNERDYALYFINSESETGNPSKIGNTRTRKEAAVFTFEATDIKNNKFRISTEDDNGSRIYMCMDIIGSTGEMSYAADADDATEFTIERYGAGFFIYKADGNKKVGINRWGGASSTGFAGYNGKDDGSRIILTYPKHDEDMSGVGGKTYGIINRKNVVSGYAMMSDTAAKGRLERKLLVTKVDPDVKNGTLLIAKDADIPMWKFTPIEDDLYYLTTEIDNNTKFLRVDENGVTLSDTRDEQCVIEVIPGSGNYAGKVRLMSRDGCSIRMYENGDTNGFGVNKSTINEYDWINLVEESSLRDEDFTLYVANKVSISDRINVKNGSKVVIYTRVWNDITKEYEYFAVDHNGDLVSTYESGDTIQWVGGGINTLLWDFTEYTDQQTGEVNNYYELQNTYSGKYLAPQVRNDQILQDGTIGLNINGRRYGDYYSPIIAWDDDNYDYSGLRVENGRLVPCHMADADDLYFAIMDEVITESKLSTVKTVDNNDYGISMKMIDYNNNTKKIETLDSQQQAVIGDSGDSKELATPYLKENGYPAATKTGKSLAELFAGASAVNHLFLASTYEESGYFEYNCTENFAHLNEDGNFTVYNQIGTMEHTNVSLPHGQFMPYNDLTEGVFSKIWSNQTDETDAALPDSNPRKYEALYSIPYNANKGEGVAGNANYHFGMEMEAEFTQTASGLDAWGHDIIFEFAGDDDMWLYVDGVLVLDLGGIHKAQVGKVNFRTGDIRSSRGNTTLKELFSASYKAQHPGAGADEVNEWLRGIFKTDENGNITSVFADYSTHSMKMLYMERGAGASNLHMKFNLASVKPGTVILGKKLTGTDEKHSSLTEFAYQIEYRCKADGGDRWNTLGEKTGDTPNVTYAERNTAVKYMASFTPAGGSSAYRDVFFLKPGEFAEIRMPEDVIDYRIIECGIDPRVYDEVKVNDRAADAAPSEGNEGRYDYRTEAASVADRSKVEFENHVSEDAVKTLTITKKLFREDGVTPLSYPEDKTPFSFRLYLGNENDPEAALADMYGYHVRDEKGRYCRWDSSRAGFVSLGKTDYSELTAEEKAQATFTTSMTGAISRIPADYTVEVRNLIVGTKFMAEERQNEIPKGYTLQKYVRTDSEGNIIASLPDGENAESGIIRFAGEEPRVEVRNIRGWGISVNKVWSDADYMASHDPIYIGIYTSAGRNGHGKLTLIEGSIRRLVGRQSLYWYFQHLEEGKTFDQYVVREVKISNTEPEIDEDGFVTEPGTVTPVDEGGVLELNAKMRSREDSELFRYTVSYKTGELSGGDNNVRTDTVTNSRPGIRIIKTDMNGNALAGAVFTLTDAEGRVVGAESFTSEEDGFVTIAYLSDGTYMLEEVQAPSAHQGLTGSAAITVSDGGMQAEIRTEAADSDLCEVIYETSDADEVKEAGQKMPVITIRNRKMSLRAVKVSSDGESEMPLAGAEFAVFRQVRDAQGRMVPDKEPLEGYENLVSGRDGLIADRLEELKTGTYYLRETNAPDSYAPINAYIAFTIERNGTVSMQAADKYRLESSNAGTDAENTIIVVNARAEQKIMIKKTDITDPYNTALEGAEFDLYEIEDNATPLAGRSSKVYSGLVSDADGMLYTSTGDESGAEVKQKTFTLSAGEYSLVETKSPDGYLLKDRAVSIIISADSVTYDEGTMVSATDGLSYDRTTGIYTMLVTNNSGTQLPAAGGIGTTLFYVLGTVLIAGSSVLFIARRRAGMDRK